MVKTLTQIKVLLSSPGGLDEERQIVSDICAQLNEDLGRDMSFHLEVAKWETHVVTDRSGRSQQVINNQIGEYDIYLGLMANRFGSDTGLFGSGTEEEFEIALERNGQGGLPKIMFYFSSIPVDLTAVKLDDLKEIEEFRNRVGASGVYYEKFESLPDLARQVRKGVIHHVRSILERDEESEKAEKKVVEASEYTRVKLRNFEKLKSENPQVAGSMLLREGTHDLDEVTKILISQAKRTETLTKSIGRLIPALEQISSGGDGEAKGFAKKLQDTMDLTGNMVDWYVEYIPKIDHFFFSSFVKMDRALSIFENSGVDLGEEGVGLRDVAEQVAEQFSQFRAAVSGISEILRATRTGLEEYDSNAEILSALLDDFAEFLDRSINALNGFSSSSA